MSTLQVLGVALMAFWVGTGIGRIWALRRWPRNAVIVKDIRLAKDKVFVQGLQGLIDAQQRTRKRT